MGIKYIIEKIQNIIVNIWLISILLPANRIIYTYLQPRSIGNERFAGIPAQMSNTDDRLLSIIIWCIMGAGAGFALCLTK